MNLVELRKKYNSQKKCIKYLEKLRWGDEPVCPYCENSEHISKRIKSFRYQCNNCHKSFSVLVGTIFEGTNMKLNKWFLLISLMVNAKMGISSKELGRHLGVQTKTAWFNAMKVRCAMVDLGDMIDGIVEMDEAYLGGRPRKPNEKQNKKPKDSSPILSDVQNKRGRGTRKVPVVGVVSRGKEGRVATKVIGKLTTRNMLAMLKKYVRTDGAILMTDEFPAYKKFDEIIEHHTIDHSKEFAKGVIHTNTIEGFWSLLKNGIRGSYRAVSKKYLPFYLAEFSYKYNRRNKKGYGFEETVVNAVTDDKCLVNYKPRGNVKDIVYKGRIRRKHR